MRAALLESVGQPIHIVDDLAISDPAAGQVRVAISHCGCCHSDLSVVDGVFPSALPVVLGHEAAGVVEAVGDGVSHLAVGDRVVLTPSPPCGQCYGCVRGEPGTCVNTRAIMTNTFADGSTSLSRGDQVVYRGLGLGAFGEQVLVPATGAVRIDDGVPTEVACVIGCAVQTGVGAVLNTARVPEGATVLVTGLGGVGLSVVQGARLAGASRVIVSDPVEERREAAKRFGATDLLDPTSDDVVTATRDLTGGIGADYAFEAAGNAALITAGLQATRAGGTVVCVGAPAITESITITPAALFVVEEKKLLGCTLGSSNSLREIPRLVSLWQAGRLDLEALITARRPMSEINEAFDDLRASRGIRTVLAW